MRKVCHDAEFGMHMPRATYSCAAKRGADGTYRELNVWLIFFNDSLFSFRCQKNSNS